MKRTALRLLAISSLLLSFAAHAAERPRYGGILRVEMRESWNDSANPLRVLVFETLTRVDDAGRPQPQLATSWESQNDARRWQFWLRRDVRFHDGTPLTAGAVVASLTAVECKACPWTTVRAVGDSIVFEFADARPVFAAELALPRYAIQHAGEGVSGTGPFRSASQRGTTGMVLGAFDDYWGGRPFMDSIEVSDSRSLRDQATDFELGRVDVIEVGPEFLHRLQQQHARTSSSQPAELIALGIRTSTTALQDQRLRQAISLAIDRSAIYNVVLQKQGEIAGGMLPNWISGYAFLLPRARELARAQQLRAQVGNVPPLKIAAESDPLLQLIADRIALNLRDAGLVVQTAPRDVADLYVTRQSVRSTAPSIAFEAATEPFTNTSVTPTDSIQQTFAAERDFVAQGSVVPLAYVPRTYAIAPRVRNWAATADGRLRLEQVWIDAATAAGARQ